MTHRATGLTIWPSTTPIWVTPALSELPLPHLSHHCCIWVTTALSEPPILHLSHHCPIYATTALFEPSLPYVSYHRPIWATTAFFKPPLPQLSNHCLICVTTAPIWVTPAPFEPPLPLYHSIIHHCMLYFCIHWYLTAFINRLIKTICFYDDSVKITHPPGDEDSRKHRPGDPYSVYCW